MVYLILMNPDENKNSMYKGAICVMDGKPWYVTNMARPTICKSENEANKIITKLFKSYSVGKEFQVMSVESYLELVGKSSDKWGNNWINQLRQEQLSL